MASRALSLVEAVAAFATAEYCGGCGAAVVAADVTYARTGSLAAGLKAGVITEAEASAYSEVDTGYWATDALATGALGGTFSSLAGGSFARGFELGAAGSLAQSAWTWYVGHAPGWGPGQSHPTPNVPCTDAKSNCYVPALADKGNIPAEDADKNVMGLNRELTGARGQGWYQSGTYSIFADRIAGIQAVSQFHDTWMNALAWPSNFANFASMPLAAAATYFALVGGRYYYIPSYQSIMIK